MSDCEEMQQSDSTNVLQEPSTSNVNNDNADSSFDEMNRIMESGDTDNGDNKLITPEADSSDSFSETTEEELLSNDNDHNVNADVNHDYFYAYMRKSHRQCEELVLPKTATLLEGAAGEKLYLIGTAHFSKESCEDVQKVISMVQPDAVVVELCASRTQILTVDESQLTKISDESGFSQLRKCIKQKGVLSGLVLYTMLYMSAHITKQLGMAPGSEFRAAFNEAKKVPGCRLYLGDRPISITLHRMLASLSLWQKIRFGFLLMQELKPISAEDVERLKQQDIFEQLLEEMITEFPHMTNVLVFERDTFISGYLQRVMKTPVFLPGHMATPPVVVGVFGIGHCNGIKENFPNEVTSEQMEEIQQLPPPSKTKKVLKITLKGAIFLVSIYSAYKIGDWLGVYPKLSRWW